MNDDILDHSDEYQIFFTVSEVDDKGNPYEVMDCRGTWKPKKNKFGDWKKGGTVDTTPVPSPLFANKTTWKERAELTPKIFEYTYRDTWIHNAMADGARELFNQRLLPPLTREDADWAVAPYDQDRVGLKGHFNFDIDADENDALHQEWPLEITRRLDPATGEAGRYTRPSYLLPKFYLSVRVMKCPKGKKALIPRTSILIAIQPMSSAVRSSVRRLTTLTNQRSMGQIQNGRSFSALISLSRCSAVALILTLQPSTRTTLSTSI